MKPPRTFDRDAYGMFMLMLYYENIIMRNLIYQKTKAIQWQAISPVGAYLSGIRIRQIERLGTLVSDGTLPQNVGACN